MNFRIHNRQRNIIQDVESLTYFSEGIMVEHHMTRPTLLRPNMYHELLKGSGKLDQNGVEIFDGDIIEVVSPTQHKISGYVRFEGGCFIFDGTRPHHNLHTMFTPDITIIGNWKTGVVNNENV